MTTERMRGWCAAGAVVLISWTVFPAGASAQLAQRYRLADLKALEEAFVKLAEQVRPGVVAIQTYYVHNADPNSRNRVKMPVSRGSGLVIDSEGYIATNRHVLEEANAFAVILDNGQRFDAAVAGTDPRSDLAVIKIDAGGLTPVRFGDLEQVAVNQWAFVVGNRFGLAVGSGHPSVTFGVVSALDRDMTRQLAGGSALPYYGNLIETSAAINPGSSGGPLFNVDGEVIGIVTAIETGSHVSEGAGFAIPINGNTRRILDQLKKGKSVRYGFLGVEIRDAPSRRTRHVVPTHAYPGVELRRINPPDGPAGVAGLLPGDILIEYDGVPVENVNHLVGLVNFSPVGTEVTVTYLRKRVKRKTAVTIGDRYELLGIPLPQQPTE